MIVARKLHERRYRPSPTLTTGELLNLIGSDGMQEALEQRWVVPDMDSGFLMINTSGGKLLELENACRCACGKTDCTCAETKQAAQTTMMPTAMREAFAGLGLPRPGTPTSGTAAAAAPPAPAAPAAPATVIMPRPPATPTTPAQPPVKQTRVGDQAAVIKDNVTYRAKVSGVEDDGRLRLNFEGPRPDEDRAYSPNEVAVDQHA